MGERDKLHTGDLYLPNDPDVIEEQLGYMELLYDYNQTRPREQERRQALLRRMLAEVGEECWIEPPFHANWGGRHVHFGKGVYANYGLTLVDDTHIYVGDYTMFGPHVTVATAGHPILPELREKQYQYNMPVHRAQLLDRRGGHHPPRRHHRRQHGGGRGERGPTGPAGGRGGGGEPLPGPAPGGGAGPAVLLPGPACPAVRNFRRSLLPISCNFPGNMVCCCYQNGPAVRYRFL